MGYDSSRVREKSNKAFNADSIVFDNTPWRPGRDLDIDNISQEEERRLKQNLATRILSNGVEVLVKDKNTNSRKPDQRRNKLIHLPTIKLPSNYIKPNIPKRSLLTSAVATVVNHQQMKAMFPLHQLMQHNYIIKTCLTTYTYLTTVVQNKRSAVSTFETIVSVITTESLTNLFASDLIPDIKPTKTKYMEVKTIQPSEPSQTEFQSSIFPKINKRVDNEDGEFDFIQPSEVNHTPCTTSCPCSQSKTEYIDRYKTKFNNQNDATISVPLKLVPLKTSYGDHNLGGKLRPTKKETFDKATSYRPYEYETETNVTPIDKVVEKYTEVISDYSDEKDVVKESELLTNEQAPTNNNNVKQKQPQKNKTEKPIKHNKNKFVVADLLKLGSLGIKGLSQLAPVIEKMTGTFMKRQDVNNKTVSTTTMRPQEITNTPYNANKRIDNDIDFKHNSFPIYIPVDELEVSETQYSYKNATLHQNLAWANDHKHPKAHNIIPPKIIHESPLVNGGIPISPGEIITANSDVIVGKPAVGGPLTLTASGLKLQNTVIPPQDSYISSSEQFIIKEKPSTTKLPGSSINIDDSYDLRPPELPRNKQKQQSKNSQKNNKIRIMPPFIQNIMQNGQLKPSNEQMMKTERVRATNIMNNHGTPAFLDYIPSLGTKPNSNQSNNINKYKILTTDEFVDSSPSSSEIINSQFNHNEGFSFPSLPNDSANKPFLVDIQPSRVANVLIPHGSSTALVFAGSSEPHKTGDYIDDPLPYPEPGYFGSFSIDAPQMTNVHNVAPNTQKPNIAKPSKSHFKQHTAVPKEQVIKQKWRDNRQPNGDFHGLPPPTSNQETHFQVGPHITSYNPNIYNPSNGDFDDLRLSNENNKVREGIDKEYENYLAVPPPPPKRNNYDNRRPYQRPIVHTKPIQDMKVFLNIQHPVSSKPTTQIMEEQSPPKVTSEIYFAAQSPDINKQTYTVNLPNSPPIKLQNKPDYFETVKENDNSRYHNENTYNKSNEIFQNIYDIGQSFSKVDRPIKDASYSDNNMYTVTLNTATNVANRLAESGQVVGSSIPVAIGTPAHNFGPLNAEIPIGTNFAIKVDDYSSPQNDYNLKKGQKIQGSIRFEPTDNRWNISTNNNKDIVIQGIDEDKISDQNYETSNKIPKRPEVTFLNSHANFPMVNEPTTISNIDLNVKPVTEEDQDKLDQNNSQPPRIPSSSNSHGWFSNNPIRDLKLNSISHINNIKVESSTRNIIPLSEDYSLNKSPDFGQKITSIGKPPTEFWNNNKQTIGKPFTKPKNEASKYFTSHFTTKPLGSNYIPSNIGSLKQTVYDIPIKDNYDDTTTITNVKLPSAVKPMYESTYETYDDIDEDINDKNESGEVSQESMSVPFVSTSPLNENAPKLTTKITLLQEEVLHIKPHETVKKKNNGDKTEFVKFNPDTQTEKPFAIEGNVLESNSFRPSTETNKHYNMKPRPFTINSGLVLDHQLHQPHWQINQLWVNQTNLSSDENIDLNYGERVSSITTIQPPSTQKINYHSNNFNMHYNKPPRNVISVRPNINQTYSYNDSNIITSTFHIKDKKPLTVLDETNKSSSMSTFTIPSTYIDNSSSEIVDLSPPPPTIDINFKPTNNDETIMGMSPPPPQKPQKPVIRPATRSPLVSRPALPPPYRTKPPRTPPPRGPVYKPTRKPINEQHRDEISTYRPSYDVLKNNMRQPVINANQPSSQLLPPPKEASMKIPIAVSSISSSGPAFGVNLPSIPNIIFPTPTSSGWLTSSGIGFSSSFDFAPTEIQFPIVADSSHYVPSQTENSKEYSESSSENPHPVNSITTNKYINSITTLDDKHDTDYSVTTDKYEEEIFTTIKYDKIKPSLNESVTENSKPVTNVVKEITTESLNKSSENSNFENNESQIYTDRTTTDRPKLNLFKNRDRTRKPYPVRETDKKPIVNRFKPLVSPTVIIKPTRTLIHSDIVHSTKLINTRRIIPVPGKGPIIRPSIIESSEYSVEEDYIKPTEVLTQNNVQTIIPAKPSKLLEDSKQSIKSSILDNEPIIVPTHHGGNEVKVYDDEIIPTKTEFKTTVITLTKTLLEPPKTVSRIGYVNITHTLTVTQTKTSLISQSAGAVTQTLVLTNTHTSTIVDVVTKVQTEVQPTTIIETVTKHIPVPQVEPTPVLEAPTKTIISLDDVSISSEEENVIINDSQTTENVQKIDKDEDNDNFFVVMNKSQNGGSSPPVTTDIETDYDGITRNEQVNNNGVSQVLFGEILLAGTPYLETTNIGNPSAGFSKECQPDCKASRNERCQRIDGIMKCVCRPGFARMFPDRPCKPTYTYSVKLALSSKGKETLKYQDSLSNNATMEYNTLALAAHEGINRMVMQSDLRDVYHGVHITGFHSVEMRNETGDKYQGVVNDFYVQLSDNAHESRLKEVIEKYLRNNNYSLGGTDVFASSELINNLDVSDFDECTSVQFHDCSEHAQCFNLRGTYTCSCFEGFADLSVNNLYPGRICSAEPVGCELCNYHGACYSRDDRRVLCECFQWYAGSTCHINLKVVLISLVTVGAFLTIVLVICAIIACSKKPRSPPQRSIVACIQGMPGLHQGAVPKQRADRRALISERAESGDASSVQNASLPYMPTSKKSSTTGIMKKCVISEPPTHEPPPPPAPAVMIPRARLHPPHRDSRENASRKQSLEVSEAKLISYLEAGASSNDEMMRRKHSMESSYSAHRERHSKQGALVSAGFKVSTTIRVEDSMMKEMPDDLSSITKQDLEAELDRYNTMRKSYSHEELSEWTDAERRIGELTLSEARSVGGTLPASTGRAASSTRLTHQEANTMAERDLGSTFLLPHVHLYKPDITSDVSEFDSL